MTFGKLLKTTRLLADLSQEDMAEKTHLSRSTVSRLENDRMELKAADLVRWLQATQLHDVAAATTAIVAGVDLAALAQMLTAVVGGFIRFI
ncbi:helix-turn-helix transcriptional regulator [Sporosarcina sp. FSL K6-1522]|uniref:helix-turn-helix domain-containing protein n=1 Tax=Sporosarcina sp. FSL K6-1522 TaxID=2921554 RepID=UPI00315A23D2